VDVIMQALLRLLSSHHPSIPHLNLVSVPRVNIIVLLRKSVRLQDNHAELPVVQHRAHDLSLPLSPSQVPQGIIRIFLKKLEHSPQVNIPLVVQEQAYQMVAEVPILLLSPIKISLILLADHDELQDELFSPLMSITEKNTTTTIVHVLQLSPTIDQKTKISSTL
jgi:hypothetical protein